MVLNESSNKKRPKKRLTIENTDTQAASLDSEVPHSSVEDKMKEYEVEVHSLVNEGLQEEVNYSKKKRKKDKKRNSELKSCVTEQEMWKDESDVILETPERTPKKKIKGELKYSVQDQGVADVLWAGPSGLLEVCEETPKKLKKKKKRDSAAGDSAGQGSVLSDSVNIDESPIQILGKDKKTRKEIKVEINRRISEVTIDEEGDVEGGISKKKHTMDKKDMRNVCNELEEPSLIPGMQGIGSKETVKEEVEVIMKESDHVRKKKKKDKKRDSEVHDGEVDVEAMKGEVDIILDTPEQTPKIKKKKVKDEFHMGADGVAEISLVESPVVVECDERTPKKTKKKKKRESEYGDAAHQSGMLSEDVVKLEEISGQTPEVRGKLKKQKWYIDPEPSVLERGSNRIPTGQNRMENVSEELMDIYPEGHHALGSNLKKWKRRHTMDIAGAAAVNADSNSIQLLPDMEKEVKSHHKKRQSLIIPGYGAELLSPKKERKIKKESIR